MPDGSTRTGKPADLLRQAEEEAGAAGELFDCIGTKPPKPEGGA